MSSIDVSFILLISYNVSLSLFGCSDRACSQTRHSRRGGGRNSLQRSKCFRGEDIPKVHGKFEFVCGGRIGAPLESNVDYMHSKKRV